jgi:hypothetical protein
MRPDRQGRCEQARGHGGCGIRHTERLLLSTRASPFIEERCESRRTASEPQAGGLAPHSEMHHHPAPLFQACSRSCLSRRLRLKKCFR